MLVATFCPCMAGSQYGPAPVGMTQGAWEKHGTSADNPYINTFYQQFPGGGTTGNRTVTWRQLSSRQTFWAASLIALNAGGVANNPPVANNDAYSTGEDTQLTVGAPGVLANDTDPDLDLLTSTILAGPTNGSLLPLGLGLNGSFVYTPNADFNGADSFTYTVSDGRGGSAVGTVSIDVTPANDPPVRGSVSISPDPAYTNDTLTATPSGFTDPDGDPLTYHYAWTVNGNPEGTDSATLDLSVAGNGDKGDTIEVSVTASDGNGGTSGEALDILVVANTAPVAGTTAITPKPAYTNDTLTATPTGFTDADGDPLIYAYNWTVQSVLVGWDQTLDMSAPGYGDAGEFVRVGVWAVDDDETWSGPAFDSLTVANTPPVAGDDSLSTAEDTAKTVDVLANDSDADGDPLTVTGATDPTHGTTVVNPDDTITYTPDAGWSGTETFDYTISDGNGGTDTGTVNVTVTAAANTPPVAGDDSLSTAEDTAKTVDVLANDSDADGDPLTVTGATDPTHGTTVVNPDDTITYTPDAGWSGTETFDYTISDGNGGTDTGTVNVTVTAAAPEPPTVSTPASSSWTILALGIVGLGLVIRGVARKTSTRHR